MEKLFFDIETVRQFASLNQAPPAVRAAWEYVAAQKYPDIGAERSYHEKAGLHPEFGRIVCISFYTKETGGRSVALDGETAHEVDEFALLSEFSTVLEQSRYLIGHAIRVFDIPYIITRMVHHRMPLPGKLSLYGKNPYSHSHIIDTKDVWKQGLPHTTQAASLIALCLTLGIESPKDDISGAEVGDVFWNEGAAGCKRIVTYCEKDVNSLYQCYNAMRELKMVQ